MGATIFHAAPYSLGTSIQVHFRGHLVGGLTWEPLAVYAATTAAVWVFRPGVSSPASGRRKGLW